jgi:hypothetical protein
MGGATNVPDEIHGLGRRAYDKDVPDKASSALRPAEALTEPEATSERILGSRKPEIFVRSHRRGRP